MAEKKVAKKETGKKEEVKKTSGKKKAEEKKCLDKKLIIIIAAVAAIVVAVVLVLVLGGQGNPADGSTTAPQTTDAQKVADNTLWEEHNALFENLNDVYYRGVFDNYKRLVPLAAWELMAEEEGLTLEEVYAKAEQDLAAMELPENTEYRFYISKTTQITGEDYDAIVASFTEAYSMDAASIGEIYELEVQVVVIANGERSTIDDVYYSMQVDGVRYLATDTGFVG